MNFTVVCMDIHFSSHGHAIYTLEKAKEENIDYTYALHDPSDNRCKEMGANERIELEQDAGWYAHAKKGQPTYASSGSRAATDVVGFVERAKAAQMR
jgi:hypothetical protein